MLTVLMQSRRGWTDGTFHVDAGYTRYMWYSTCEVRIANRQPSGSITYCWNDLRGVTEYIAWNCDASHDSYGGYCLMNNNYDVGEWHKIQYNMISTD